jgi:hypothetical protein
MFTRVRSVRETRLGLAITTLIALFLQLLGPSAAQAQPRLELRRLETVSYAALPSGNNFDRPSIAVRRDGQVRISITDFGVSCCPLLAPLKVVTRRGDGDWSVLTVTNHGDHAVPHFLPTGELGVLYMDFADLATIKFARVDNKTASIEDVQHLGLNPSAFEHLVPWFVRPDGEIQAVTRFELRFRRTAAGWNSAAFPEEAQDIAPFGNGLMALGTKGLFMFANGDLASQPSLIQVPGGVPCCGNLVLDRQGRPHIAYLLNGNINYGVLLKTGWKLETVKSNIDNSVEHGLLNDQALTVDSKGRPYLIYRNPSNRVVIATKRGDTWIEQIDLGQGLSGNMVLGPSGDDLHATFTSTIDGLVRYAQIRIEHEGDGDDRDDHADHDDGDSSR